jgi:hypothetical protein
LYNPEKFNHYITSKMEKGSGNNDPYWDGLRLMPIIRLPFALTQTTAFAGCPPGYEQFPISGTPRQIDTIQIKPHSTHQAWVGIYAIRGSGLPAEQYQGCLRINEQQEKSSPCRERVKGDMQASLTVFYTEITNP